MNTWLVELGGDYRLEYGDFQRQTGSPETDDGALIFSDDAGEISFIYAPGTWMTVCPE